MKKDKTKGYLETYGLFVGEFKDKGLLSVYGLFDEEYTDEGGIEIKSLWTKIKERIKAIWYA